MVIPAMLAVTIAYLVTQNTRIYVSQVPTRADSPAHRSEYVVPLIQTVSVADAMRTTVVSGSPSDTIADAEKRMQQNSVRSLPIVEQGKLIGMFTVSDALRATNRGQERVSEAMSTSLHVAYPSDSIHVALRRMTDARISRLPVVHHDNEQQLLGMISTRDIARGLDSQLAVLANAPQKPPTGEAFDHFGSLPVTEAMSRDIQVFDQETPARDVFQQLSSVGGHAAMILDNNGFLTGIATLGDLGRGLEGDFTQPVKEVMSSPVVVARETQSLAEALAQPGASSLGQLPVVTGRPGSLEPVGILRQPDVVAALLRARDRQATISRRLLARAGLNNDDLTTIEVSVHHGDWLAGRTLAELNLPQEAIVTSLVREGRAMIPRGRLILHEGDQIQITTVMSSRDLVVYRVTADRHEEEEAQPAG